MIEHPLGHRLRIGEPEEADGARPRVRADDRAEDRRDLELRLRPLRPDHLPQRLRALGLAARHHARVAQVVAINPYDYGRRGGIRRSSALANMLFTAMLWPGIGPVVARTETRGILRHVLEGGLHDPARLPAELVDELSRCGRLPGHARAFRSLCLHWQSWIDARASYGAIELPVTLVYGDDDWSRPPERDANARAIPGVRTAPLTNSGHFSSLEKPSEIAELINELA